MSKEPKKNNVSERPSLLGMKCLDCREEILQRDPQKCPYCGSTNLISKKDDISNAIAEIEKLKKAGRYEDAALRYEELEMWDKADETRNMNMGKVSAINLNCPHCGASQQLSSKINEVTCKHCGKKYGVPKKILELF
jgi:DNA-directed RNA polymerase subunit RPC12/RpoP